MFNEGAITQPVEDAEVGEVAAGRTGQGDHSIWRIDCIGRRQSALLPTYGLVSCISSDSGIFGRHTHGWWWGGNFTPEDDNQKPQEESEEEEEQSWNGLLL